MVTGLIRMGLHQASDLLDDPGRPPGWTFTDPAILQGWGRGSAVVPGVLAAAVPELAGVRSFLDADAYDCAWVPTFFVTEPVLEAAMPRLYRALSPGGWLVLGRMASPPDPLAQAVSTLRTIRGGGADFDAKRLVAALEAADCTAVRVVPRQGPAPMEYVIGRR